MKTINEIIEEIAEEIIVKKTLENTKSHHQYYIPSKESTIGNIFNKIQDDIPARYADAEINDNLFWNSTKSVFQNTSL
jgi:hypothetical protein